MTLSGASAPCVCFPRGFARHVVLLDLITTNVGGLWLEERGLGFSLNHLLERDRLPSQRAEDDERVLNIGLILKQVTNGLVEDRGPS